MYKTDELIKCCGQYPVYRQVKDYVWVECLCCRKRTINTFRDKFEANLVWNQMMLGVRDPRKTPQGKAVILSMIDERGLTLLEVAEIAGIKKTSVNKVISRIREEFDDSSGPDDGTIQQDGQV